VATAFILLVVPLISGLIAYAYHTNAELALAQASRDMDRVTRDIVEEVDSLLSPAARVVESVAVQARMDQNALRRTAGLRYFHDQVANLPQLESLYIGFNHDGSFYQVVHLVEVTTFGPLARRPPESAQFVLRILDFSSSRRADSFLYLAGWDDIVRVERGNATYDPRLRPWYKAAWTKPGTVVSDVYPFATTAKVGLTVSRRIESDDGVPIGTVGADITLDRLSRFLDAKKIGRDGRVFIVDKDGRMIAHPQPGIGLRTVDKKLELVAARDVSDEVVAGAARARDDGAGDRFTARLGGNGDTYMVSFAPFPEQFGKQWAIGIAVNEDEFIGPLRRQSYRFLAVGGLIIFASVLSILWMAHRLTRPLSRIALETDRIKQFELDGDFDVQSRITEVKELADAVSSMKKSLRSFGAYVPKALVRNIVAAGGSTAIGGERQFLTVMFTDIKSFTSNSEAMSPEDVLVGLSDYLQEMSEAIHANKGVIDKFIGDAVMAVWNAPVPDPDHVANACRAMLACRDVSNRMDQAHIAAGKLPLFTRFGLHCGQMMVGNVGSSDRMQFTVLGSAVNLASRLEGLNKEYGTQLLVSDAVRTEAEKVFLFRQIDRVMPSGVTVPIGIHELVAEHANAADLALCQAWDACLDVYHAGDWKGAGQAFAGFLAAHPDDGPAKVLAGRCARFVEAPPPPGWDFATRFDHK